MMKYYVVSRYHDNGKIETQLLPESQYQGQQAEDTDSYSQYVDEFSSLPAAKAFVKECQRA